jgi:folylpolyglutamate synthase/dihydropteroate synthase
MSSAGGYADLLARLGDVRALGVDLGLDRVRLALARLGDPQTRFAAVQIAGTNGKGSTAAMTEGRARTSRASPTMLHPRAQRTIPS